MQTLQRIEELNAVEPFRPHGINQFADLTTEEFAARFLMPKGALAATQQARLAQAGTLDLEFGALPDTFDWRNNGSVITPVKNQEQCGRCVVIC
jgi:C1A family cysteine protease